MVILVGAEEVLSKRNYLSYLLGYQINNTVWTELVQSYGITEMDLVTSIIAHLHNVHDHQLDVLE